ncbi:hypothetical protein [Nocardia sp. NRRL S-836]|uniref:hypothetical protein n=1 Tax=Nocardia sp. NRRL S-836 TaxID=1519492 RepID=UPI0006AF56FE|nr:hypothetical protein [Nocardia sp. NRRL S-836]KOV77378.1 hypothetical protein ADL03_41770 [Nocardia sp. NRRL S-836]
MTSTLHPATQPGTLTSRYFEQATADQAETTWALRLLEISRLLQNIAPRTYRLAVRISTDTSTVAVCLLNTVGSHWTSAGGRAPGWLTDWRGNQGQTWDDVRRSIEHHLSCALTAAKPDDLFVKATAARMRDWGTKARTPMWTVNLPIGRAVLGYSALDQSARHPDAPLHDLRVIVDKYLDKEHADYGEQAAQNRAGHPYLSLLAVNNWLAQLNRHGTIDDADHDAAPTSLDTDLLTQIITAQAGVNAAESILTALDQAYDVPAGLDPGLRGTMIDGYTDGDVNTTLGQINNATGTHIICLWDRHQTTTLGDLYFGHSNFFIVHDGRVHELAGELWSWLNNDPCDPDTPLNPGRPDTWSGSPTPHILATLPAHDGRLNYALRTDVQPCRS